MGSSDAESDALRRLLATDLLDVAPGLFLRAFPRGGPPRRTCRDVRNDLAALTGIKRVGAFGDVKSAEYQVATECFLLWEHALLAAREWVGDSAVPYLHRLRRGEQVMAMADPYNAVRTALSAVQPPRL